MCSQSARSSEDGGSSGGLRSIEPLGEAREHACQQVTALFRPAVVGTQNAGERIRTGDRIRVNGNTGVVEILS